jgi:peroxiredoxin
MLLMCAGFVLVMIWPETVKRVLTGKSGPGELNGLVDIFQGSSLVDPEKWADIRLPDLNGNKIALSDFKGRVIFLNFWATWCPSCVEEMADIQRLHQLFEGKKFVIVTINVKESRSQIKRFLESQKLTFTTLMDPSGETLNRFSIRAIPTTIILDRSGRVIDTIIGPRDWASKTSISKFKYLIDKDAGSSSTVH